MSNLEKLDLNEVDFFQHGYLPIAASYCKSLDIIGLINNLTPSKMDLSPGLAVQAMVLDTLSGRSPLYRLEEFIESQDSELLLGEKVAPGLFNDSNVGRAMDQMFKAGPSNILTAVGKRATEVFKLNGKIISYDTTSTSVWGSYDGDNDPGDPVNITYGYSKDKRPDLKQYMTELICVERGIPIFGSTLNGNSSDKTSNNEMLSKISSIMAGNGLGEGAFIYVADSAMVTKENLDEIGANLFITRLPATYKECSRVIETAVALDGWDDLGELALTKGSDKRPLAKYKTLEMSVNLYDKDYRAIIVHSSAHDKRRRNKVERDLKKSEKEIKKKMKGYPVEYFCEDDALKNKKIIENIKTKLHNIIPLIETVETRRKGRPPKNGTAPTQIKYKISYTVKVNTGAVKLLEKLAGCFVLITNVTADSEIKLDPKGVLRTYKDQYAVEHNFAFLKDPLIVNDLFLKKASRIEVLGMVMVISLTIWRLMERSMRVYVENTGKSLPGLGKRNTKRPTSFMLSVSIRDIKVIVTKTGERIFSKSPPERQLLLLEALGVDENIFVDKGYICTPIIPI